MANYTYGCKKCGEMDISHSIKDDAMTVCPVCGGKEFKRLIGGNIGVVFKGTGFYETDYKRKGEKK